MTTTQHGARIALLTVLAAGLLGWLSNRTEILFADGLRYIAQAQRIEHGAWREALLGAVDHPVYPLAIAASHRFLGVGGWLESPEAWQAAAQGASVVAGVLLVAPLYLIGLELFGAGAAWLGVVLFFLVPVTGHVLADVLSEGTFLLFWAWGLWAALRFLRQGSFAWLPPLVACGVLAYLTRPEGLLLPAALVATLVLMPLLRSTRLNWPRWWAATGVLVIGPALVVAPFALAKGGLTTKPAVQKLLGTAPRAAADAVERSEPLDPNQSEWRTHAKALKAVWEALRDLMTVPLVPLAVVGLASGLRRCRERDRSRAWLLLGVLGPAAVLALVRLHVTGGYCTPRHAMVPGLLLIPAAAHGVYVLLARLAIPGRLLGLGEGRFTAGPAVWAALLVAFAWWNGPKLMQPINQEFAGYRQAADWLASPEAGLPEDARLVDPTGWALYYGERPGYTFATLREAPNDAELRYVVAREAHMKGEWWYCDLLRHLVGHRVPVQVFPEDALPGQARVYVFDRREPEVAEVVWGPKTGPVVR